MDQVYGLRDHYSLLVHGGLATMRRHGRSGAREVFTIAQRERERERKRRSSRFSPMSLLVG
jgi:hypothetical protein